jgi:hypothetical protein
MCTCDAGIGGNRAEIPIDPETVSEATTSARDQGSVVTSSSPVLGLGDVASLDVGTPDISSELFFVQESQGEGHRWLAALPPQRAPEGAPEGRRGPGTTTNQQRLAGRRHDGPAGGATGHRKTRAVEPRLSVRGPMGNSRNRSNFDPLRIGSATKRDCEQLFTVKTPGCAFPS